MYYLKTPGGAVVEMEEIELRQRIASGEVRAWDHVSTDGELFIQIRGLVDFREAFEDVAVEVSDACYRHEERPADMRCGQCARGYCTSCLPASAVAASDALACPACGHPLQRFHSKAREKKPWMEPGRTLLYPLRDLSFVTTIVVGLMMWAGMLVPPISFIFYLMALAWVAHVVATSADGKRTMGFGPDLDDMWHLVGRGFMVFLVTLAVAIPIVAWNLIVLRQVWVSGAAALPLLCLNLPLWLVAFVYYPMALGMAAVWNNKWVPFQPHHVVSHILLIKEDYAILLVLWAVLLAVSSVVGWALSVLPVLGGMLASIVSAYFLLVKAHMLGYVLYLNSSRLDWD